MNNAQPSKPDPKGKAIASFVLGCANLLLLAILMQIGASEEQVILPLAVIGLIGLVLGIMGLKSSKRIFAMAGVVLCILALLPAFFVILYLIIMPFLLLFMIGV